MKRTLGIAAVAGVLALWPASTAHAQFTYGYDSAVYNVLPSASYYDAGDAERIYTDPGLGIYLNTTDEPFRGLAPYSAPPLGVGQTDAMSAYHYAIRNRTAPPARVKPQAGKKTTKAARAK